METSELQGAELAAAVAREVMGWEKWNFDTTNHLAYRWRGSESAANDGAPYDVSMDDDDYSEGCPSDWRPDKHADQRREMLAAIERWGLWSEWSGIMLVKMRESGRDWRDQRSIAWYVATADPTVACRAALEAVREAQGD